MFDALRKPRQQPSLDLSNVNLLGDDNPGPAPTPPPAPRRPSAPVKHVEVANSTIQNEIMRLTEHGKALEARIARDTTELNEVRATVGAYMAAAKVLASGTVWKEPPAQAPAQPAKPQAPSVASQQPAPVR